MGKPLFQSKNLMCGELTSDVGLVVISGPPKKSCRPFHRQGVAW